jgi:hypothetical protein
VPGSLGAPGPTGQDPVGVEGESDPYDPRWRAPYEHDRRAPFLDLVVPSPDNLPRPLRIGIEHWDRYMLCTHHRRRGKSTGCHHHQHPELEQRLRGSGRGRPGRRDRHLVKLAHKRSESAEHHVRLRKWMLGHMDLSSRYVGKPDGSGAVLPFSLEEIAKALRRPGEEALPMWILCDALNAAVAAEDIDRHRARRCFCSEHQIEDCKVCESSGGPLYWRSKVATLRVTVLCLIRSGVAGPRAQYLKRRADKERAAELERQRLDRRPAHAGGEFSQLAADLAHQHSEGPYEKFLREVRGARPTWSSFAVGEEVDRLMNEWRSHRDEARKKRRQPPDQP